MQFSDYKHRTPEQILADLNAAWDRIKQLAKTKDQQQKEIQLLKAERDNEKLKRWKAEIRLWVVSAALVGLWEVLKFLILHR